MDQVLIFYFHLAYQFFLFGDQQSILHLTHIDGDFLPISILDPYLIDTAPLHFLSLAGSPAALPAKDFY